jgi:hypothetical protein
MLLREASLNNNSVSVRFAQTTGIMRISSNIAGIPSATSTTLKSNQSHTPANGGHPLKRIVLTLAMLAASSSFALGQAIPGATRKIDIQAGGLFTYAVPDYTPQNAVGYGIFGDIDITPHWGAELAYNSIDILQHSPAKEWTFEYGARYHRDYGRYSPYLKVSAGRGTFDFAPDFYQLGASVSYNLISFGGGTDIAITNRFGIRAGMEYQNWFTGGKTGPPNIGGPGYDLYLPHGLTPALFQVGITYHITGSEKIQ